MGETGDRCDEQSALQIEHDEIRELYCKAKIHLLDQLKHSYEGPHHHLTAIYYLKSLYGPNNLRLKLMKE